MEFAMEKAYTAEQRNFNARCHFFWPFLRILWDPPSKLHWFKAIIILRNLKDIGSPMPPNAVLSAARHGRAVLAGGAKQKTLQEIVMQSFADPSTPKEWESLQEMTKCLLEAKYTRRKKSHTWRPIGYRDKEEELLRSPAFKIKKNQKARQRGNHLTVPLKREHQKALAYLDLLYAESMIEKGALKRSLTSASIRLGAKKIHNIKLKSISVEDAGDLGDMCGICRDPLGDRDNFYVKVKMLAQRIAKLDMLPKGMSVEEYIVFEKENMGMFSALADNIHGGHLLLSRNVRDNLLKDLWEFSTSIYGANEYFKRMENREVSTCFYPTKLACGHIFGLKCIDKWINGNSTCPFCRADLPGLSGSKAVDVDDFELQVIEHGNDGPEA